MHNCYFFLALVKMVVWFLYFLKCYVATIANSPEFMKALVAECLQKNVLLELCFLFSF